MSDPKTALHALVNALEEDPRNASATPMIIAAALLEVRDAIDRLAAQHTAPLLISAEEVVEAVMDEMEIDMEQMPEGWIDGPAAIVQRALNAAKAQP